MSGPQFLHLQSYSRKANKGGQSVGQVLDEAERVPAYSEHVCEPQPPKLVFGVPISKVRQLHDEMCAAGRVEVKLKDGVAARRGVRRDRHTLMTAVASHPLPTALVNADVNARADYEAWRDLNIEWLKITFGDKLMCVIEHWDEKHPHIHAYILPRDDPSCSARHLNPAWCAKEEAMETARATGNDDKTALKLGNAAYRTRAREIQDDYFEKVGLPCGLTRTGPKRRRLSRQQWKAEKEAAKREAQMLRDMEGRLDALIDAEDWLDQSIAGKIEEIAAKLDMADQALAAAKADQRKAEDTLRHAESDAKRTSDAAVSERAALRVELEARHQDALETDRSQLRAAKLEAEREAEMLRHEQTNLAQDRTRQRREAAREATRVVLQLVLGVLDGSIRPHPAKDSWIVPDDDLRKRVVQLKVMDLIKDTLTALHETWQSLTGRLSSLDRAAAKREAEKPIKAAQDNLPKGPSR